MDLSPDQKLQLRDTADEDLCSSFAGYTRAELRKARALIRADARKNARAHPPMVSGGSREEMRAEIARLSRQVSELSAPAIDPRKIAIPKKHRGAQRESVAIICASDWHAEETVTREQTNGLNEFNLDVFESRAKWLFANAAAMVGKEAAAAPVSRVILWLGGDLISGSIHEDLIEGNSLGPIDALSLVQDVAAGGIDALVRDTKIPVDVIVSVGNHSRITRERRVQTEHANSLEWLLGLSLGRHYSGHKHIRVICERAYHTYVDVLGHVVRFHHGHNLRYAGGVNGLNVPAARAVAEWNRGRAAELDVFGHFHALTFGRDFAANGSLVGHNAFAVSIRAAYQQPSQAFLLIDSRHGLTTRAPIYLDAPC